MTGALASYHLPASVMQAILGSLGGALAVAAHLGGYLGAAMAHLAHTAFISGMDLGLRTGAAVAAAGGLLSLAVMPSRPAAGPRPTGADPGPAVTTSDIEPAGPHPAGRPG